MQTEWTFDSLKVGRNSHRALPVAEPLEPGDLEALPQATLEPFEPRSLEPTPTATRPSINVDYGVGNRLDGPVGITASFLVVVAMVTLIGWLSSWFGLDTRSNLASTETGTSIFSAMALNTAHPEDADLEHSTYFVLSQMGAAWTYALLKQQATGVRRLDVLLIYRQEQAAADDYALNAQLSDNLPSYYDDYKTNEHFMNGSCVCGNGAMQIVQIQYDEVSPMHRVSLVVHEYYHVVQAHYCGDVTYGSNSVRAPYFLMWLSEGAATVTEHLYTYWWFGGSNGAAHASFSNGLYSALSWVKENSYVYSTALNDYPGVNNYYAETVAVLQLIQDYNASYVLRTYLTSGKCNLHAAGGNEQGFLAAFPMYASLQAFYDLLNTNRAQWELDSTGPFASAASIGDAEVYDLFGHEMCSDSCATALDGVCDDSCLYGSDCTDCGAAVSLPVTAAGGAGYSFPVTLAPSYQSA